jgi:hypothetical protein
MAKEKTVSKIEIAGRIFEDIDHLRTRLGLSVDSIVVVLGRGMPMPIRVGRKRFFETERVDEWLLAQTWDADRQAEGVEAD